MATTAKSEPSLASALASAFAEIEGATKDKVNPHFKAKYADLSSVIDAIKPALVKHRLFFTQSTHEAQGGVCVETIIHHESGDQFSFGKLFMPATKGDAQGFGSALTYARRYSLMTAFGVPAEDDDGNAAARPVANDAGRSNGDNGKDAPFPQGPCRNLTELKTKGRAMWTAIEGAQDQSELDAILRDKEHVALTAQLIKALPSWWDGGTKNGEAFEGLDAVINRQQRELPVAWQANPLSGG